jgi:hypothetical protein
MTKTEEGGRAGQTEMLLPIDGKKPAKGERAARQLTKLSAECRFGSFSTVSTECVGRLLSASLT